MDASLLIGLEPSVAVMVLAASFVAAMLGGMSGFGSGLIITLFITPIIGAKAVIPVLSVMMTINNASRIWFFRAALDWHKVRLITATAVPASALGAMLYVRLESAVVQILLGAVLVLSIPLRRWLNGRKIVPDGKALLAFGAAFGFLSSLMIGTGILIIPMLLGAGLASPALLATDAAISMIVNIAKALMFGKLDALTPPLFLLALAMGLMTIPGTWVAAWIVKRTHVRVHTTLVEILIIAGGIGMIYQALA